ncbi:MAG: hypothetical protein J0M30_14825 [Chitinophagales bacterium]|nr:hypothetical protein [Chitinophagales bacterium]
MVVNAGIPPDQFYGFTLNEVVEVIIGYQTRQIETYRNTRILVGTMIAMVGSKENILDVMPLPGDPSPEERIREEMRQKQATMDQMQNMYNRVKELGLL